MGGHDAPQSWLERWREQEPVRLYLWSVATAVLVGAVVAGWLTRDLALAIAGPVSAVLMVGGASRARSLAYAPATVAQLEADRDRELEDELQAQHRESWQDGWDAGVAAAEKAAAETKRTPEKVAAETRPQTVVEQWLEEHPDQPATALLEAQGPCTYVEDGRACTLPRHPGTFPHQLEGVGGGE